MVSFTMPLMEDPSLAPIYALEKLRNELQGKLSANPDYISLRAVEDALEKLKPTPKPFSSSLARALEQAKKKSGNALADVKPTNALAALLSSHEPTISDVAHQMLRQADQPMTLASLVHVMELSGTKTTSESLSSILSRDDRFKSVQIRSRRFWALREWPDGLIFKAVQTMDDSKGGDDA